MKHIALIIMIILSSTLKAQSQEVTDIESVIKEKIDSYLVEFYKGNLDAYTELFAENGVYYFEGRPVEGKEKISNTLPNLNFPKVKFTNKILHMRKIDNTYVVAYQVTEEDGFRYENHELWQDYGGDFKIVYARFNELGNQNQDLGIQPSVFFIAVVLFGFFLFLMLVAFQKAWKYKTAKR